jgi:hypothetical protein
MLQYIRVRYIGIDAGARYIGTNAGDVGRRYAGMDAGWPSHCYVCLQK